MLAQPHLPTLRPRSMNRTSRGCFAAVLLIAALALLPGCSSTQVRTARDTAGKPLALSGTVVMIEPDIELSELGAGGMAVIGGTVAIISGERSHITKAIEYFIDKNVGVEVIKDARATE